MRRLISSLLALLSTLVVLTATGQELHMDVTGRRFEGSGVALPLVFGRLENNRITLYQETHPLLPQKEPISRTVTQEQPGEQLQVPAPSVTTPAPTATPRPVPTPWRPLGGLKSDTTSEFALGGGGNEDEDSTQSPSLQFPFAAHERGTCTKTARFSEFLTILRALRPQIRLVTFRAGRGWADCAFQVRSALAPLGVPLRRARAATAVANGEIIVDTGAPSVAAKTDDELSTFSEDDDEPVGSLFDQAKTMAVATPAPAPLLRPTPVVTPSSKKQHIVLQTQDSRVGLFIDDVSVFPDDSGWFLLELKNTNPIDVKVRYKGQIRFEASLTPRLYRVGLTDEPWNDTYAKVRVVTGADEAKIYLAAEEVDPIPLHLKLGAQLGPGFSTKRITDEKGARTALRLWAQRDEIIDGVVAITAQISYEKKSRLRTTFDASLDYQYPLLKWGEEFPSVWMLGGGFEFFRSWVIRPADVSLAALIRSQGKKELVPEQLTIPYVISSINFPFESVEFETGMRAGGAYVVDAGFFGTVSPWAEFAYHAFAHTRFQVRIAYDEVRFPSNQGHSYYGMVGTYLGFEQEFP